MSHKEPYHPCMQKNLVDSTSLRTLIAHLDAMIGPERRFPSINAMAVALGLHATTLRRYMNMESDITLTMLDAIAGGLGVRPEALLDPASTDVAPADRLAIESLAILKSLPTPELERVFQMLSAYASPTKGHYKSRPSATPLDDLTASHDLTEAGHADEGVSFSASHRHKRKRAQGNS